MTNNDFATICVLGRQPMLGLAELESLYGADHVMPVDGFALLNIESEKIDFKRLGGTMKVAKILARLPYTDWAQINEYLAENAPKHLEQLPEGGLTFGVSLYGISVSVGKLNADMLGLKKILKKSGRSIRVVPNKTYELNSAQVLRNKLTHRGGWEILAIRNSNETILAQTMFVQDIDAYAARDQARPKRDSRVGMLPPKLAQIIINLAVGTIEQKRREDPELNKRPLRLLDPFCGTGVVLQEALLMGYSVMGSDIEPKMIDFTSQNIDWLVDKYPQIEGYVSLDVADATDFIWPRFSAIASEVFLGRPLANTPKYDELKKVSSDANTIIKKFLANLAPQLQPKQRICIAVPAWRVGKNIHNLSVIDHLTDMGYNRVNLVHVKNKDLVYFREDQIVARELLILEKA